MGNLENKLNFNIYLALSQKNNVKNKNYMSFLMALT